MPRKSKPKPPPIQATAAPIPIEQQILTVVKQNQTIVLDNQVRITDVQTSNHKILGIVQDNNARIVALEQNVGLITDMLEKASLCCLAVLDIVKKFSPLSLTVIFSDEEGEFMGASATLPVGGTANATAHEWSGLSGTGVELPLAGAISWVSSDPTIATVDPSSGLVTAVAAGTATITATDAANGLTGSGVVSDTPLVAQSLTVDIAPNASAAAKK